MVRWLLALSILAVSVSFLFWTFLSPRASNEPIHYTSGTFAQQTPTKKGDPVEELEALFPKDSLVGWKATGVPVTGKGEALGEHKEIEEVQELITYGVAAFRVLDFSYDSAPSTRVRLEVFRMSNLMAAFGIYSSRRSPLMDFLTIGNQAFVEDQCISVWKSRYFIRATLVSGAASDDLNRVLAEVGRMAADRIPGNPELPRYLRALPAEGLVINSQKYEARPFLGLPFLRRAVTAEYTTEQGFLLGFFIPNPDDESAATAFGNLTEHCRQHGQILDEFVGFGSESIRAELPEHHKVVFLLEGRFIAGVLDMEGNGMPTPLLTAFIESFNSTLADDPSDADDSKHDD